MPEILCPMCSKANEAGAEACAFCGARLKPLVIDSSSEDMQADDKQEAARHGKAPDEPISSGTDWLGRMRSEVSPVDDPEPISSGTDWLGRMRSEVSPVDDPEPISSGTDRLERLRSEVSPSDDPEPISSGTDWLGRLRSKISPVDKTEPSIAEGTGELPDWLDRLPSPGDAHATEEVEEIIDLGEKSGDTDWLDRLRQVEGPSELTDADWDLIEKETASSAEDELARPEIPEWLKIARDGIDVRTEIEEESDQEVLEDPVVSSQRLAKHSPEPPKLEEADEQETGVPGEVIGEPEVSSEDSEEELETQVPDMVYVPPLILDDETHDEETQDIDLESIRVPEWIEEEQALEPAAAEDDEQQPEISRAVLPEWLEGMRPDEINSIQDQVEGDEPQSFETIGPLAGLSGVLMAEPVVAMPRTPGTVTAGINITQQENEQVRILRKLVEAEQQDIASPTPRPRAAPILQWIVGLVLVAAVILPQVVSGEFFAAPRWVPQDLEKLRGLVEELAVDNPALIVVDYDPGYSAELEAVGSSLLDHLFQRGMTVVTLSTRSPGPALAQRLIDHVTPWHVVEPGDDYLHLGYLAGGPTAVQLFASNPRYGNLRGFMLPAEREWSTPWEAPILADVQQLSDFSAVLVITAGTETARTWAEQAAPLTGETPFIMVLSAGAEPLVRPYYANPDPQVDAIFTGLPSAKANELLNGRSGAASLLWDAFGTGGWAATGVLVVGGVMGITASLLRRRARDENDV